MITAAEVCSDVNRKEATGGGIIFAIDSISSSAIGPGPLGILATSPTASAPCRIAIFASAIEAIQHILILVRITSKINTRRHKGQEQTNR
jgi:hypothetical protein